MRYKLTIEYDGTKFPLGWQMQPNKEGAVQNALINAALKLFGTSIEFYGAGRTDSMVHALGQVAHFDLPKNESLRVIQDGMNFYLRQDNQYCRIQKVEPVSQDFHARFSAKCKEYEYRIYYGQTCSIFNESKVWWIRSKLKINWDLISNQAQSLIGHHDFSAFRSSACQSVNVLRNIDSVDINNKDDLILFKFYGKSFLHKQIRIMVGTLIDIGSGKITNTICDILEQKNRKHAGQTAPGYGLYLKSISY